MSATIPEPPSIAMGHAARLQGPNVPRGNDASESCGTLAR